MIERIARPYAIVGLVAARFDAQRTVDGFAERLRDEMDVARLGTSLVATTNDAVRPTSTAVWLRAGSEVRR